MDGNIRLIRSWDPISRRWDAVRRLVCVVRRRRQCPRIKVFSPLGGSGRRTSSGKAPVAAGRLSADPSDGSGLAAACINHISLMSASRPLAGRTRAAGAAMDGPVPAIAGTLSSIIQAIAFRRIRHCWSPDKKGNDGSILFFISRPLPTVIITGCKSSADCTARSPC